MMKKTVSLLLALVLALGLAVPALAVGPTFNDVPSTYWGYADIEAVAEAGLMNGTGNGAFSPEMKVSAAQFLTLLGRLVFPETTVGANDTWFGPYVAAAQSAGLLTGTQVDVNQPEAEISRYDMAVILRAAGKQLGVAEKAAQSGEVTDYGEVPTKYAEAVLAVYGMGLIRGDQAGNFNGANTMMRAEVATVIMRLAKAKPGSSQGETTDPTTPPEPSVSPKPEKPVESEKPAEPEFISCDVLGWVQYNSKGDPQNNGIGVVGVPVELRYTEDNGATYTVIEVATTEAGNGGNKSPGRFQYTARIEKPMYDRYRNGEGQFYFSAEATVNGQRYVTQDRRTDGKATIIPIKDWIRAFVDLVPPNRGETVDITVSGRVEAVTYVVHDDGIGYVHHYNSGAISTAGVITNSTVRIYFDDQQAGIPRVLLGETTADGGSFHETIAIDTAYYRTTGAYYVVEVEATLDGQLCKQTNNLEPITLRELAGNLSGAWFVKSDEYYEQYLKEPRP